MTLIRLSLFTFLMMIVSSVYAQAPVNNDMQQFLQSRLQTLKQNEAQLKTEAATNPGNMTTQLDLASVTQEIQQLEAILGTPPQAQTPTSPSSVLQPPFTPAVPSQPTPTLNPMQGAANMGMPGADSHFLQPIRDNLLAELKSLQTSLTQINAQADPQFHQMLEAQQAELLKQLQDIDAQMKTPATVPGMTGGLQTSIPPNPGFPAPVQTPLPMNQEAAGWQNLLHQAPAPTVPDPIAERIKNLENTAAQLRAAGQSALADQTLIQAEQLRQVQTNTISAPPVPQPPPYSPETAAYASPWMTQPAKEIVELKNSVDSLRTQIEQMQAGLNALENQLQLLNRNMVHETGRLDQILNQGSAPVPQPISPPVPPAAPGELP